MKITSGKKACGILLLILILFVTGCGTKKAEPAKPVLDLSSMTPRPTSEAMDQAGNLQEVTPGVTQTPQVEIKPLEPVTISFVGDVFTSDQMYANYTNAGGITGVVSQNVLDIFQNSDIMVANHEYCSTDIDDSNKADFQTWIEQCDTKNEFMFGELGIDVAGVANNHMFDYGEQGFIDTLNGLKEMGITYVGGGFNYQDATEAKVMNVGDKSIAFFASNNIITRVEWIVSGDEPGMNGLYTWSDTYTTMLDNIKTASETNDLVVVMLHFGTEKDNQHTKDQTAFAHACIDAGADVIIGHHAHVLQGIEYYGDGVIFYGLGNFLFSNYTSDTMVVTLTLERDNSFSFKITPCQSYLYYTKDVTTSTVFDILNKYSVNAHVASDGTVSRTD
ncbi:MAG: CapA family protein [Lachnospiraceae bacterium]